MPQVRKPIRLRGLCWKSKKDVIVVQKGKEKWEILKTADTKVKGDLKVGAKVTIEYTMSATAIEVK